MYITIMYKLQAVAQVKAHLVAKNTFGAGAGAVGLKCAVGVDMAQQVFVRCGYGVWGHGAAVKLSR